MKVLVLGSGIVGVSSAYYLAKAGHQVTVLDRQPGPGLETSFANGGQIAASHAEPWAGPNTPARALKWLGRANAPLLYKLRLDPALWSWSLRFLLNCTRARTAINTERTLRMALYSRQCLAQLRGETGLHYDEQTRGILHLYWDAKEYDLALKAARLMASHGLTRTETSAADCVALEPALANSQRGALVGGLYSPDDESGDAYKFTTGLTKIAQSQGVTFRYSIKIYDIGVVGGAVSGVETTAGPISADAVVVALGSYSPLLVAPLGITLPVYPAKGYSATIALTDPDRAPTLSLTDDELKLVYSRLGNRLRVAGTAEFSGYNTVLNRPRAEHVLNSAMALFPGCGDPARAELWTGLRPKTPDSVPVVGKTAINGLYLNTGHGTLGWTMSCGSGKLIADLVSTTAPDIDPYGLGVERFDRWF